MTVKSLEQLCLLFCLFIYLFIYLLFYFETQIQAPSHRYLWIFYLKGQSWPCTNESLALLLNSQSEFKAGLFIVTL